MVSITNEYFTIQAKDEYQPYLEMILKMITEKAEIVRKFFDVSEYRPLKELAYLIVKKMLKIVWIK